MLAMMSLFSFDILPLECFDLKFKAYYINVYLWCVLPLMVGLVIVFCGLLRLLIKFPLHDLKIVVLSLEGRDNHLFPMSKHIFAVINQHTWLLLLLSYLVLPAVTNKQLQVFDCIKLRSGERYLRVDTSINCQDQEYYEFRSVVIMFIALYQLIPITWFLILYRNKAALVPSSIKYDEQLAMFIRDNNHDLAAFRFLFIDYTCSKWWFEVADMYRRIAFIGFVPLVSYEPASRASFGMLLAIISLVYFARYEPYRVHFTNVIAFVGQVSILVTFYAALTLESNALVNIGLEGSKLGIFLLIVNVSTVLLTCRFGYESYVVQKCERNRIELEVVINLRSNKKIKTKQNLLCIMLQFYLFLIF
jgi:hypothetical protein